MYNPNDYTRGMGAETLTLEGAVSKVLSNVYGWMAIGLAITALVSLAVAYTPYYWQLLDQSAMWMWIPMIAELGLVFYASARVNSMSFATLATILAIYSALNGVTMAVIFLVYTADSIASTFFVCAAMFGGLCFVGHTTRTDMTSWGKYLMMALIGLIVASVVNIFLQSEGLAAIIPYAGVLLFTGLTAYDAQKIKQMVTCNYQAGTLDMRKLALMGSLSLYLDFVNLFLYLLKIMGNRRN